MMKYANATLIAALLMTGPALAQAEQPLGEEAETDLQIINGVPVNPQLLEEIMDTDEPRSVQELLDLSNRVFDEQQNELAEQRLGDRDWMQGGDPLGHLEGEMHELVLELDEGDTGERTQAQGQEVVDKLSTMIAMLDEICNSCQSACNGSGQGQGTRPGSGNGPANGGAPANDSTLSSGPGGSGDLSGNGEGNHLLSDLTPEQREAMLRARQGQEGFSPEIDALLDPYYQRLASEQALEAGGSDAPAEQD